LLRENLLKNLERVKNTKVRSNLNRYADQARLSRELAVLNTAAPLDWRLENLKRGDPDRKRLQELRCSLRSRMQSSELMNSRLFTSHLEDVYCQMWREYCAEF